MSVDDRLRRGLHANATAFQPEGEARLLAVGRRRRRRRAIVTAVAAAVVVALAGAGAGAVWVGSKGPGTGREIEPAAPSPSSLDESPTPVVGIPDSNWRRTVTRAQARALGLGADFVRDNFGDAERLPLVLSFVGGIYSQSGRYPGGWAVGDAGTVAYDDAQLVLTSTSPGCPGCAVAVDWRIVSGELRLTAPRATLVPEDRLMVVGSWSRQDP
jgi:hypothetical protein